nr:hypothetical protein Iba_chr04fCG15600 [Ipomoea batatas]
MRGFGASGLAALGNSSGARTVFHQPTSVPRRHSVVFATFVPVLSSFSRGGFLGRRLVDSARWWLPWCLAYCAGLVGLVGSPVVSWPPCKCARLSALAPGPGQPASSADRRRGQRSGSPLRLRLPLSFLSPLPGCRCSLVSHRFLLAPGPVSLALSYAYCFVVYCSGPPLPMTFTGPDSPCLFWTASLLFFSPICVPASSRLPVSFRLPFCLRAGSSPCMHIGKFGTEEECRQWCVHTGTGFWRIVGIVSSRAAYPVQRPGDQLPSLAPVSAMGLDLACTCLSGGFGHRVKPRSTHYLTPRGGFGSLAFRKTWFPTSPVRRVPIRNQTLYDHLSDPRSGGCFVFFPRPSHGTIVRVCLRRSEGPLGTLRSRGRLYFGVPFLIRLVCQHERLRRSECPGMVSA